MINLASATARVAFRAQFNKQLDAMQDAAGKIIDEAYDIKSIADQKVALRKLIEEAQKALALAEQV